MASRTKQNKALSGHSVLDWIESSNTSENVAQKANMTASEASEETKQESIEGFIRKTYYFRTDHVEKIAARAFQDKGYQKDIIEAALDLYFNQK